MLSSWLHQADLHDVKNLFFQCLSVYDVDRSFCLNFHLIHTGCRILQQVFCPNKRKSAVLYECWISTESFQCPMNLWFTEYDESVSKSSAPSARATWQLVYAIYQTYRLKCRRVPFPFNHKYSRIDRSSCSGYAFVKHFPERKTKKRLSEW